MKDRRTVIATVAAVATATAACAGILGIEEPTARPVDADTGALDADTGALDADTGAPDAGADVLFCSTKDASLCWSFDEPPYLPPYPPGSPLTLVTESGEAGTTSVNPKSPPYALDVTLTTSGAGIVGIHHQQAQPSMQVRCTFDVRVETVGATGVIIAELSGNASSTKTHIVITPNLTFLLEVQQVGSTQPAAQIGGGVYPLDTWLNVSLEVDAKNVAANATVEQAPASQQLDVDAGAPTLNSIYLGAAPHDTPSVWRLAFDNFFCTGF